jgi:hypothetical protein
MEEAGLDPGEFSWENRQSTTTKGLLVPSIVHRPTGYYFLFDAGQGTYRYKAVFMPGEHSQQDSHYHDSVGGSGFKRYASIWIEILREELLTPDLWAETATRKTLVEESTAQDTENTPFSADEVKLIFDQLNELFNELLATGAIEQSKEDDLRRRLDYLAESSRRLGRKDWIMVAVATIQIILAFILSPEASHNLLNGLSSLIQELMNVRPLLP